MSVWTLSAQIYIYEIVFIFCGSMPKYAYFLYEIMFNFFKEIF